MYGKLAEKKFQKKFNCTSAGGVIRASVSLVVLTILKQRYFENANKTKFHLSD